LTSTLKFTKTENKEHWNKFAKNNPNSFFGASYDKNLVELENYFIINVLKKIKPKSLLDIGCGNGYRTKLFSKYVKGKTIGIDYAEKMIKQAKKIEDSHVSFELADIWDYKNNQKFDSIVSCRCFINQNSLQKQVKLFQILRNMTRKNGHLLLAEASNEGLIRLNKLRDELGLPSIEEHWFNHHIKENRVFARINNLYNINQIRRLGLFYFTARVIHPSLVWPKKDKKESKINDTAKEIQLKFFYDDSNFEDYGRHLLMHLKAK